jgi:AICAR transformylase/IMP cyclohydrolase PurH
MSLHTHLFLRKSKNITSKKVWRNIKRQDNPSDVQMEEFNIPQIDLVIVDLYPFEKTVASGASEADIIEKKIDIGIQFVLLLKTLRILLL